MSSIFPKMSAFGELARWQKEARERDRAFLAAKEEAESPEVEKTAALTVTASRDDLEYLGGLLEDISVALRRGQGDEDRTHADVQAAQAMVDSFLE